MSKHECEDCGESFETLSRKRLHDCSSDEESQQEPETSESSGSKSGEKDRPMEVEQGLEPEYDCPECDYYKTGISTAPQSFLDHLRDEHGYSSKEAHEVLNG